MCVATTIPVGILGYAILIIEVVHSKPGFFLINVCLKISTVYFPLFHI